MFAFGNVLYELYEKHLPFDGYLLYNLLIIYYIIKIS